MVSITDSMNMNLSKLQHIHKRTSQTTTLKFLKLKQEIKRKKEECIEFLSLTGGAVLGWSFPAPLSHEMQRLDL